MNTNDIIDVTPLKHSRTRTTPAGSVNNANANAHRANAAGTTRNASTWNAASTGNPYGARSARPASAGSTSAARSIQSRAAGLVQMLLGAFLVMIGVPLLILPGPGLLSIVCGLALAASGFRKMCGIGMTSWFASSRSPW